MLIFFFQAFILELLSDGGDLFDAILVSGQVAFKGLVFLFQSFQFRQAAWTEILIYKKRELRLVKILVFFFS